MTGPTPGLDPVIVNAVRTHGHAALQLAVYGRTAEAARAVEQIEAAGGPEAVQHACLAWADVLIDRYARPAGMTGDTLQWREVRTGRSTTNADEVTPGNRWAGRLLMARWHDDAHQIDSLMESFTGADEWADAVRCLLGSVALTIRALTPRRAG